MSSVTQKKPHSDIPLLPIDIETAPMLSYHWEKRTDFIAHPFNIEPTTIICVSFRDPRTNRLVSYKIDPRNPRDDRAVVKKLHALLTWAGQNNVVLLYQNGDAFDLPKIESRVIYYDLPPLPKLLTIDTLRQLRQFGFDYGRLDYIDRLLNGIGKMDDGGFKTWKTILEGTLKERRAALDHMVKYCEKDIEALERVYHRIKRYMKVHPNANLWKHSRECCPSCGSAHVVYASKPQFTLTRAYRKARCRNPKCGRWFRDTMSLKEYRTLVN